MLTQYKNIEQIQSASGSISAERLSRSKTEFASFDAEEAIYFNTEINKQTEDQRVEMHVYAGDTWITGNHRIQLDTKIPEYKNKSTNVSKTKVSKGPIGSNDIFSMNNVYNKISKSKGRYFNHGWERYTRMRRQETRG